MAYKTTHIRITNKIWYIIHCPKAHPYQKFHDTSLKQFQTKRDKYTDSVAFLQLISISGLVTVWTILTLQHCCLLVAVASRFLIVQLVMLFNMLFLSSSLPHSGLKKPPITFLLQATVPYGIKNIAASWSSCSRVDFSTFDLLRIGNKINSSW